MTRLRVATWNIHGAVGFDRRRRPERIAAVLGELDADIVVLQELVSPCAGVDLHALVADATGHALAAVRTMRVGASDFGNAILCRWPIETTIEHDLSHAGREPRAAIEATIDCGSRRVRVIGTHLGLGRAERIVQSERLRDIARGGELPTIVAGDFNLARASGATARSLDRHFGATKAPRTFPSPLPLLPLDRIWATPPARVTALEPHRSRLARIASDHLPLKAIVEIG